MRVRVMVEHISIVVDWSKFWLWFTIRYADVSRDYYWGIFEEKVYFGHWQRNTVDLKVVYSWLQSDWTVCKSCLKVECWTLQTVTQTTVVERTTEVDWTQLKYNLERWKHAYSELTASSRFCPNRQLKWTFRQYLNARGPQKQFQKHSKEKKGEDEPKKKNHGIGEKKNERMETRRKPKKKIHIFSFNPQPTLCCCVLRLVLLDRWSFVMLVWGVEVSYEGRLLVWLRWDRTIRILVFSIETNVQMSLRCGPCGPCGRHANETR